MRYYIDGYLEILNDNYKKAYDIYKAGIEKGDLNAEFGLAEMYYNGWYVEKDEQRAIQIFNKIYKPIHRKAKWHNKDSESQLIIFCLSEWDEQIKNFKDDFFEMLKKASGDKSNPVAKWYMGEKDFEIAGWGASALVKLNYERAAACPNTNRYKFDLAMYYKHGSDGVPQDHSKAFYWCKLAAEDGFSEAQLELSNMYLNGIGTKTNVEEYRRWRTIAEKNAVNQDISVNTEHNPSTLIYTRYYLEGRLEVINGNHQKGYEIYKKGADIGDVNSRFGIAEMMLRGWVIQSDTNSAKEQIKKIYDDILVQAQKGNSESQTIIYTIHKKGYIPNKDPVFGLEMLKKAVADEENFIAQLFMALECIESQDFFLGEKYYEKAASCPGATGIKVVLADNYARGINGFLIDREKSFKWCKLAAEEGSPLAQFGLCGKYADGSGVERNLDEAVKWCKSAADNGNEDAKKCLSELIYSRDISSGNINSETALENMTALYNSGFATCSVSLVLSLLHNARENSKSNKLEDLIKSSNYFKRLFNMDNSYKTLYVKELAEVLYRIAQIFEDSADFEKAVCYYQESINLGYERAMYNLATIYYNGKTGTVDYSNALYFFKKCTTLGVEEGKSHYYIGSCFYWGLGVPADYENAKKHFIQAYEYGFNCNSAISLVESELDNGETTNSMRNYAESLKKKQLTEEARYAQIIKDLQTDFGDAWNKTQLDTKTFIAQGIENYLSIYFKKVHTWGDHDFSASINEICKALENELRVHLYSNYISWLRNCGITPNDYLEVNNLSAQNVNRSVLKRINSSSYEYEDPSKKDAFTLGNAHFTIGKDKGKSTIDKTMLDYLAFVFKTDAFEGQDKMDNINKYIISLVDDLWTIANLYRNPAAHSRRMDCKKAEACGDYIIKVKKLLIHFLDKINL